MRRVHVILLLGQICFASLPVVGRMALLGHLPPAGIVLVRMCGGAIVFTIVARVRTRGSLAIARRDIPFLIFCALLGVAANQELFIHGLARSTATNASVLGATIPVFTALAAIALGREPARMRRLIGIAIAVAGAALLVGIENLSIRSDTVAGSAMVLANSFCYGTYLVIVRPLAERYDPIALLALMFVAGVPMVAPLGIDAWAAAPPLTAGDIATLAFLVAVPTVGAYTLIQTALKTAEASLVAVYVNLQPLFAALGAYVLLGEQPTLRTAGCGLIVLAGVWLAAKPRP